MILAFHDLGSTGSTFYETPALDALAASSTRFSQAYATCQVCSPSRASIMLGTFPLRHGITDWIGAASGTKWKRNTQLLPADYVRALPAKDTTIAEAFRDAGYHTFFAGKWHLGGKGSLPTDHGFEINKGGIAKGSPPGGFYSPYKNPELTDGPPGEPLPIRLAAETADFISAHHTESPDQPFFAFLSFYAVHAPLQTTEELWKKYQTKAPPHEGHRFAPDRTLPVRQVQDHPVYAGLLETMDTAIGNVLAKLDELGLAKDTIVVFTSDHGGVSSGDAYATSNLPLRGGKGRQWEGGLRVPLFIRHQGTQNEIDDPVTGADLYPTLLDLAGIPLMPDQHSDGLPIIENEIPERSLVWHYPHYGNQGGEPSAIILKEGFKLIHYFEDGRNELYDLAADPGEKTDLSSKDRAKMSAYYDLLQAELATGSPKYPVLNPAYDPDVRKPNRIPKLERQHAEFLAPTYTPGPTWWGSRP